MMIPLWLLLGTAVLLLCYGWHRFLGPSDDWGVINIIKGLGWLSFVLSGVIVWLALRSP